MKRKMKNKRFIRHIVQAAFLILITAISVNKGLVDSGGGIGWLSQASLHALCPFGGVVSVYNLATLGTFVKKIHASSCDTYVADSVSGCALRSGLLRLGMPAGFCAGMDRKGREKGFWK